MAKGDNLYVLLHIGRYTSFIKLKLVYKLTILQACFLTFCLLYFISLKSVFENSKSY